MIPIIDKNRCNVCAECLDFACPAVFFKLKQNRIKVIIKQECLGCEFCVDNCPSHAIKLSKKNKKD